VAVKVSVKFNGPVVARVKGTFVTNCGEDGGRIHQSGGWWWARNGKWQHKCIWNLMDHR